MDFSRCYADSICTALCLLFHNLDVPFLLGSRGVQSCLEVAEVCVGDALCNAQLALYLKACSADGELCDVKHCQAAIRFFYQNMPFNIAQMLAFCDCAPADEPCQQSREALHSRPCAVNRVPTPTCLDVIHSCQDDELCRWVKTCVPCLLIWHLICYTSVPTLDLIPLARVPTIIQRDVNKARQFIVLNLWDLCSILLETQMHNMFWKLKKNHCQTWVIMK